MYFARNVMARYMEMSIYIIIIIILKFLRRKLTCEYDQMRLTKRERRKKKFKNKLKRLKIVTTILDIIKD